MSINRFGCRAKAGDKYFKFHNDYESAVKDLKDFFEKNPDVKYGFVHADCIDFGSGYINYRSYRYKNQFYKSESKKGVIR